MKTILSTVFLAALAAGQVCLAQTGQPSRVAPGLSSPLIDENHQVTFRLQGPNASTVLLQSDFLPDTPFKKGTNGVWSLSVGPVKPDIYYYNLVVDGVRALDPGNPNAKIGFTTSTITSILELREDQPAFYDLKNVPHGVIRGHLYESKSNGATRELNVYTPPGYDEQSGKRYPVLYLLHGANNDQYSWLRYGRAAEIIDNLLAEKAIEPFIVVMPLGYGGASADGRTRGPAAGRAGPGSGSDAYERDVIEDIIPFIDKTYRSIADHDHRAIVGFSMGGGHSSRIGLGHLDVFGYIGVMSAGMGGGVDAEPMKSLAANATAANERIKLLWIACGKDDFALSGAKIFSEALTKAGIKHTFVESEGAHHWRVWRRYLHELSPLLFK